MTQNKFTVLLFILLFTTPSGLFAQTLKVVPPEQMGMCVERLSLADSLIEKSIQDGDTPGAVLAIVRDTAIVYKKAYGWMQMKPTKEIMRTDVLFDLASLTKPIAAGTAIMKLVENGLIRLTDPVSKYLPEFRHFGGEKRPRNEQPQIIHLLTHTAGLPSYAPVDSLIGRFGDHASDSLMSFLSAHPNPPAAGTRFIYSCPGFIALQKIVEKVTGESLSDYSEKHLFQPAGMMNTFYTPKLLYDGPVAPTLYSEEEGLLSGIVHDPLARKVMNGVSGNAGLFSTADDLALYAALLLNNGRINEKNILTPASVRIMTGAPEGLGHSGRSPGWDISSSFASNQGDLLHHVAYGHTGYTGTSLVIDPESRIAILLLTNRVYPDDRGSVVDLRAKIANVVASSIIQE